MVVDPVPSDLPESPHGRHPSLSLVVTATQGCRHGATVIAELRRQARAVDELLIIELDACTAPVDDRTAIERHLDSGGVSEDRMRLLGLEQSRGDVVVIFEDHGVPEPRMLNAIRDLFDTHPQLEACTFFLRNGTQDDVASRALFAFVGGFADADAGIAVPRPVCSSFAVRRSTWQRAWAGAPGGELRPGSLEYDLVPRLANKGLVVLPTDLTITHFQRNTVREAVSAVFWNARIAGSVEAHIRPAKGRLWFTAKRYVVRVPLLNQIRRRPMLDNAALWACAVAGFTGWWIGGWVGPGDADAHLRAAHPVGA